MTKPPRFQDLRVYSDFLGKYKDKQNLHLGIIVRKYFNYAEYQIRNFERESNSYFDTDNEVNRMEECFSYAFSFYTLIRTSLEASRVLNDRMTEASPSAILQEFRDTNLIMLTEIINTANDIVKHPFKDPKTNIIYFCEPYSLDISGNMGINVWSNPKNMSEEITINPVEDCDKVFEYLENLAKIYLKILE